MTSASVQTPSATPTPNPTPTGGVVGVVATDAQDQQTTAEALTKAEVWKAVFLFGMMLGVALPVDPAAIRFERLTFRPTVIHYRGREETVLGDYFMVIDGDSQRLERILVRPLSDFMFQCTRGQAYDCWVFRLESGEWVAIPAMVAGPEKVQAYNDVVGPDRALVPEHETGLWLAFEGRYPIILDVTEILERKHEEGRTSHRVVIEQGEDPNARVYKQFYLHHSSVKEGIPRGKGVFIADLDNRPERRGSVQVSYAGAWKPGMELDYRRRGTRVVFERVAVAALPRPPVETILDRPLLEVDPSALRSLVGRVAATPATEDDRWVQAVRATGDKRSLEVLAALKVEAVSQMFGPDLSRSLDELEELVSEYSIVGNLADALSATSLTDEALDDTAVVVKALKALRFAKDIKEDEDAVLVWMKGSGVSTISVKFPIVMNRRRQVIDRCWKILLEDPTLFKAEVNKRSVELDARRILPRAGYNPSDADVAKAMAEPDGGMGLVYLNRYLEKEGYAKLTFEGKDKNRFRQLLERAKAEINKVHPATVAAPGA